LEATPIVVLLLAALGLLAGIAGVAAYAVRRSRASSHPKAHRRLPQQWPLNPRPLANSAERRVWQWLQQVFAQHHVMVKLPLTRFTTPREQGAASDWFEVLSGAYCTYTVCDDRGVVVGCIDLLGPRGLSRGNRQLKQTLLSQCGIGYWVLVPDSLPSAEMLRADFLGAYAQDSRPPAPIEQERLEEAALQLHEALDRNRSSRPVFSANVPEDDAADQTPWPQPDSFLVGLDSRHAPLAAQPHADGAPPPPRPFKPARG
jgi:hypothetical protein